MAKMTFNPGPLVDPKGCDLRTGRPFEASLDLDPNDWRRRAAEAGAGIGRDGWAHSPESPVPDAGLRCWDGDRPSAAPLEPSTAAPAPETPSPTQRPPTIKFTFVANSHRPDDPSGTGRWQVPVLKAGKWATEVLELQFEVFRDAYKIHNLLGAIWAAGKETGQVDFHDHAQQRLLKLLQDFEACRPPPMGTVG